MKTACGILFLVSVQVAFAQTDFFVESPGDRGFTSLPLPDVPAIKVEYPIRVDVRQIASSTGKLSAMPDGRRETFEVLSFSPLEGFVFDDFEAIPDPRLPDSALSYYWFGMSGRESLFISVYRGRISATVIGADRHYAVTESRGEMVFREFDPRKVPPEPYADSAAGDFKRLPELPTAISPKFNDPIKILVVHTAAALARAGSQAQLNAIVSESFGQSNEVILNSGIVSFRTENVATGANLSTPVGYTEQNNHACMEPPPVCRYVGHRIWLRTDPGVQNLRNSTNADLVVMLVADPLGGVAYTQRPACGIAPNFGENVPGCNVGAAYDNFAFAVVSIDFATSFQVFAHETGHQLGMDHHPENASANLAFPWSHGHYVNGLNETVMSGANSGGLCDPGCPRALQYSNPDVLFLGSTVASGTINDNWNARTGAALAPAV